MLTFCFTDVIVVCPEVVNAARSSNLISVKTLDFLVCYETSKAHKMEYF